MEKLLPSAHSQFGCFMVASTLLVQYDFLENLDVCLTSRSTLLLFLRIRPLFVGIELECSKYKA